MKSTFGSEVTSAARSQCFATVVIIREGRLDEQQLAEHTLDGTYAVLDSVDVAPPGDPYRHVDLEFVEESLLEHLPDEVIVEGCDLGVDDLAMILDDAKRRGATVRLAA